MTDYVSDAQARSLILDVGRRLYHSGFVASNDGNITCKVGDNAIWATPTGVSKGFMTEEMLVKMDLDGNILEGTYKPSSEIKMHLRVFKENPQVQGVVHAHPLTATAFACAGMSLDEPVLVEGILALGCVPLAHFALPGTTDVPDSIAPYCKNYNAVLLANHGALTWGTSLIQAYYRMETTEYYAKILMMNNFILGKKSLLSQQQIDDIIGIRNKYWNAYHDVRAWRRTWRGYGVWLYRIKFCKVFSRQERTHWGNCNSLLWYKLCVSSNYCKCSY